MRTGSEIRVESCLAKRSIIAKIRAPSPATTPTPTAPMRWTASKPLPPCAAKRGTVPLIAAKPRYPVAAATRQGSSLRRGEVVLERDLDREQGAGRGRLEDRGDAGRGPGGHQHLGVDRAEQPAHPALDPGADRAAGEDRESLETHRPAEPDREHRREHTTRRRRDVHVLLGRVKCLEPGVGEARWGPAREVAERERRQHQSDAGNHDHEPIGQLADGVEERDGQSLGSGEQETGREADEGRREHDVPGSLREPSEPEGGRRLMCASRGRRASRGGEQARCVDRELGPPFA